jgi:phosphoglycerate dehydrogenase-like enzyme
MMELVIASQLDPAFNKRLRAHSFAPSVIDAPDEISSAIANAADILIVRPSYTWLKNIGAARPDYWPGRVKWVYSASAGVDIYPPWLLEAPLVSCGRGIFAEEIADYVMAAIYLQTKSLDAVRARMPSEWVNLPLGRVGGSTVGIVGLGAIGTAVARRALAANARVTALRRRSLSSPIKGVELLPDLGQLMASADHIILALPGTAETRHLVNAAALACAKPNSHLINVGRGSVLDHDALIASLEKGQVAFATLDVTDPEPLPSDHPLWRHPRLRLTPHVASNYQCAGDVLFQKISSNLARFARGETPIDLVDHVAGY